MKSVIRSIDILGNRNIRRWEPDDPRVMVEMVYLSIGPKPGKGGDTFYIQVATPAGLDTLEEKDGILATRPLLVMKSYNFYELSRWLERKVARCEGDTWLACVEKLRVHFGWEFDKET